MARTGRPIKEDAARHPIAVRLSEKHLALLEENAKYYNEHRTESLRRGIELVNKEIHSQSSDT